MRGATIMYGFWKEGDPSLLKIGELVTPNLYYAEKIARARMVVEGCFPGYLRPLHVRSYQVTTAEYPECALVYCLRFPVEFDYGGKREVEASDAQIAIIVEKKMQGHPR